MTEAIRAPPSNAPRAELSHRGIEDDHRVAVNSTTKVAGPRYGFRRRVRVEGTHDPTSKKRGRSLDGPPIDRVYPEAATPLALVSRLDQGHEATVVDQE